MVTDLLATTLVVLATGVGVAFTYFGYSFVTRLTSLVGGLGGALAGSFVARTLVAPPVGVASPDVMLVSLVGAIVGSLIGSQVARATQQFAIVALCFALASAVTYSMLGHPSILHSISLPSFGSGIVDPLIGSVVVGGITGVLVWQFYLPFLTVVTSLLGASILQQIVRHWSGLLPVFHSEMWTSLGTSHVLWFLLVGTGIVSQYRRYRHRKSVLRIVRPIRRRLS
ncbi:hypothetical protein [Haladaptatus caseinilyticus]|uniref:hypothetical protein n=1 Tax=Haladaptatus caseinilyticus TaxID=2993314 RepID=UPI00224A9500|nr:hypothetical protein [Haladaptatus caseinilyticus]